MAEDGAIHLAVSDAILDEVERVLRRDKFGWPEGEIDKAIRQITRFTEHVEPKQRIDAVKEDPTDNRILECAAASSSDYLVSGDKHLLKLVSTRASTSFRQRISSRCRASMGAGVKRDSWTSGF